MLPGILLDLPAVVKLLGPVRLLKPRHLLGEEKRCRLPVVKHTSRVFRAESNQFLQGKRHSLWFGHQKASCLEPFLVQNGEWFRGRGRWCSWWFATGYECFAFFED